MHETIEALSAYVDGELTPSERARVDGHLAGCADCTARTRLLERAAGSVAALPETSPTADESRRIRGEVLRRVPRRRGFVLRPAWAGAAGALALVVAGVFAGSSLLRDAPQPSREAAGRGTGAEEVVPVLTTPEEVRTFVMDDEAIRRLVQASGRTAARGPSIPVPADRAPEALAEKIMPPAPGDTGATTSAPAQTPVGPAARAAAECLRGLETPPGTAARPDLTRSVSFAGTPAWLLVFTGAGPSGGDDLHIYLASRASCDILGYHYIATP